MPPTPEQRLLRLARHVLAGWRVVQREAGERERAREWLIDHPSQRPEVDRLWLDSLAGEGMLPGWLDDGAALHEWQGSLPLHSVLASHPFSVLPPWSIQETSPAS